MTTDRGAPSDDDLLLMITDAYRDERLAVSLQEIAGRHTARRRYAMAAAFGAAALALVVAVGIGTAVLTGLVGLGGGAVEPAAPSGATGPNAKPPRPTTSATDDGQRCADIAAQQQAPISPPPQRFVLTGPDPLRVRLYGEGRALVVCWLNHDRVDIDGPSVIVEPPSGHYLMQAYGVGLADPAYFPGPAEVAFGTALPGATAVEIRFATGDPARAQLIDGWWAYLGTGEQRLSEATDLVMITPGGDFEEPIEHG